MSFLHIEIDWRILKRIATALESINSTLTIVFAQELEAAREAGIVSKDVGRTFYQSDAELYRIEQEKKVTPSMEL